MKEYQWKIGGHKLQEFKALDEGERMYSKRYFHPKSGGGNLRFTMYVTRKMEGTEYTGFGLRMSCSFVAGYYSVRIDEVDWYRNAEKVGPLSACTGLAYECKQLADVTSLTIRLYLPLGLSQYSAPDEFFSGLLI